MWDVGCGMWKQPECGYKKYWSIKMRYDELVVWQKSMALVINIYKITSKFPVNEKFCLINQIRRASISIPSNIAEGHGRKLTKVFINHISIAAGSLMELETQLNIALRLNYINKEEWDVFLKKSYEIGSMLNALRNSLKRKICQ
jgi:four helix bundle protein